MEENIVTRLDNQDAKINNLEIRTAINENNITNLSSKLDKIDTNVSKLIWIVLAAVLGAVLKSAGII